MTLRPRQNGRHFADDMFKCIFLNENVWIPIEISLKLVPEGSIGNNPALFQIMAWRRPGDKPLSEPMMVSSLTHICVTLPQCVKPSVLFYIFRGLRGVVLGQHRWSLPTGPGNRQKEPKDLHRFLFIWYCHSLPAGATDHHWGRRVGEL